MLVLAMCGLLLTATDAGADGRRSHAAMDRITMVGNMDPYPVLERAGRVASAGRSV